jgi:hypothetical protein
VNVPEKSPPGGSSPGFADEWVDRDRWRSAYLRLGPLRYSDLGHRRLIEPADPAAVGEWLAGAADRWWAACGRPDPFTLVVVSGDGGRLASAVLACGPQCAPALRYVLVHPDRRGRGDLAGSLPVENPAFLYPAAPPPLEGAEPDDDAGSLPAQGIGPLVTSLRDLPGLGDRGPASAVVAVEFLSRLPFDAYVLDHRGQWSEIRLVAEGALTEILVPLDEEPAGVDPSAGPGRQMRWTGALQWLRNVAAGDGTAVLAVVETELPATLLSAVGRAASPAEPVGSGRLQAVEWRLG